MSAMNVLEVVGICGGGLGQHVRGLSEGLAERGHRVTVAYTPHSVDQAFQRFVDGRRHGIRFVPLKIRREISPASDLRAVVRLLRLIKREGPFDVVHGHSAKGGAIARVAGRLFGVPTVYTPNSLIMSSPEISRMEAALYTMVERLLGHLATSKFISVSSDERAFILKLKLVPAARVAVIENGIEDRNLEHFERDDAPESLDDKPLTFGSTMRFTLQKAPGNLIEAFVRLCEASPQLPVRLVIAGDGELFAQARKRVEESGWKERITLLGWRSDVKSVLRELDVFVLPSLYEGFSYSILEAMAAGLPIISTDVFGAKEAIGGVTGNIVVPTGEPGALARAMKQMATLDDQESRRRSLRKIGQANHERVRAHFRQSEVTRLTLELYQDLCRFSRAGT